MAAPIQEKKKLGMMTLSRARDLEFWNLNLYIILLVNILLHSHKSDDIISSLYLFRLSLLVSLCLSVPCCFSKVDDLIHPVICPLSLTAPLCQQKEGTYWWSSLHKRSKRRRAGVSTFLFSCRSELSDLRVSSDFPFHQPLIGPLSPLNKQSAIRMYEGWRQ